MPPCFCTLTSLSMSRGMGAASLCVHALSQWTPPCQVWPPCGVLIGHCDNCLMLLCKNKVYVHSHCEDMFVCSLAIFHSWFFHFASLSLYFACLAYSDCLWLPSLIAQQTWLLHLKHYGLLFGWQRPKKKKRETCHAKSPSLVNSHLRCTSHTTIRRDKLRRQWNHSLHQLRKSRHVGPRSCESPPPWRWKN